MTEKEMFVLALTVLEGVEDIDKHKSGPGRLTTLKRIRKFAQQYEETKAKADEPAKPHVSRL